MEHRVLHLLDKTPEKHIHEPVLASCLVSPKGDAKHRLMMVAVGGVIKGIVPGEGVGAELVKKGLEHGAEAAADKLRERKEEREGAVALPPQMYLAMGASKLGLYAVTQRSLLYFIQGELLLVPHEQVAELSIGQTHLTTMDLTLRLRNGLTLELECGKGEHLYLEQMEARLSQVHPAPPSGSLPGYGMQPPAPVAAPSMTKEYWVQEGRTAARARRFGDALAAYEAALALDPTLGPAYFGRGEALRLLNRPAEALPAFERAIQLSPQDAAPYRHAGYVLNTLKRSSEAFSALEQALRLDPTQAGTYVGIGEALQGMQRPAEALAVYDRALALDPRLVDAAIGKGAALCVLGQYAQALAAYELALTLDPGNVTAAAGKRDVQQLLAQAERPASGGIVSPVPADQPALPSAAVPGANQVSEATERVSRPLAQGLQGVITLPSGRRVTLPGAEAVVGRGPVVGPDAVEVDLTSESEKQTVSRRHASIWRTEAGFELEDLHSANQTWLNHEPLQPGRRYRLRHGDVVEFGNVRCRFTVE